VGDAVFQALPAVALAKAGLQGFRISHLRLGFGGRCSVSGFASRSFSEGWVSGFQRYFIIWSTGILKL